MAFTAIGLCAFGGGFSIGLEEAGLKVLEHWEFRDLQVGVTAAQHRWPIRFVEVDSTRAEVHHPQIDYSPTVLYGNPPCSAFAMCGRRGGLGDPIVRYIKWHEEIAADVAPTIYCWELVPQVWSQAEQFVRDMAARWNGRGYHVTVLLTSSALHGGFQDRRRFHFIASKFIIPWDDVSRTSDLNVPPAQMLGVALSRAAMAPDVLKDLPSSALTPVMAFMPPGTSAKDIPDEYLVAHYKPWGRDWDPSKRPGYSNVRARLDRPCPTLTGGSSVIHPVEDRFLTPREYAVIQGFPLDYWLPGGTESYDVVAKGLCTHTASFLGRAFVKALRLEMRREDPLGFDVIDWRDEVKLPPLTSTEEERAAWWMERHNEDLPAAWREVKARAPSSHKAAVTVPKPAPVAIVHPPGLADGSVRRMLQLIADMGHATRTDIADMEQTHALIVDLRSARPPRKLVVLTSPSSDATFIMGVALGAGVPVTRIYDGDQAGPYSFIEGLVSQMYARGWGLDMAKLIASECGVTQEAIADRLRSQMTPEEILARSLGA